MSKDVERRQRIFLVGMMGSGKTTIGQLLAAKLDYDLVDIDAVIEEHAGVSISQIFAQHGEEVFRRLESAVLADTANRIKLVFATGGGILENAENREIILNSGFVVWLRADLDILVERVDKGEERPMLQGHYDTRARMQQLLEARTADYEQAHLTIDSAQSSPEQAADEIAEYYRNWLTLNEN